MKMPTVYMHYRRINCDEQTMFMGRFMRTFSVSLRNILQRLCIIIYVNSVAMLHSDDEQIAVEQKTPAT